MSQNLPQITDEELLAQAFEITENSYVPYSKFPVGAALLLDDGTIVAGCNVENASYGLTMCAERSAVFRMVAEHGANHTIEAVAIVGCNAAPCHPCGACRQVLHEFGCKRVIVESARPGADAGAGDEAESAGKEPGHIVLGAPINIDFEKILPYAFGPEDL